MAFKGLADIKKKAAAANSGGGDGESPFLSLKDGDKVAIRFLQEFEDDSQYYDERRGLVKVLMEHSNPKDFKQTMTCTAESEGRCWACEQTTLPDIGKKWKAKMRFYANVLVRNPDGEDKVKILKRGFSDKDIGMKLVNIAEEFEGLGGMDVSYMRSGSGLNDTSYDVIPKAPKKLTKAESELELIDISKFAKEVPYDQQAAFFAGEETESDASDWG